MPNVINRIAREAIAKAFLNSVLSDREAEAAMRDPKVADNAVKRAFVAGVLGRDEALAALRSLTPKPQPPPAALAMTTAWRAQAFGLGRSGWPIAGMRCGLRPGVR